jgi:hypothetical protein
VRFVEDHREVVNALARLEPALLAGPLLPLLGTAEARPFLDFNNKRAFFRKQLREYHAAVARAASFAAGGVQPAPPALHLRVQRKNVFTDSFTQFAAAAPEALRGRLDVRFRGEEGVDAGGLTREWYEILAREMFNPNYALFRETEHGGAFQPNPASAVNEQHLAYFKFVGRVLGKALMDGQLLDAHFTRPFYKHMLGQPLAFADLEALDPQFFSSLSQLLAMPIDDLGLELFFVVEEEELPAGSAGAAAAGSGGGGGGRREVELIPGGRDVPVTDANKAAYVELVAAHKLSASIRLQTDALLAGFGELIPPSLIAVFTESELELLIAGLPTIDIDDLRANTEYVGYRPTEEVIAWFWAALESFDQQDRARFLMFVTGTSKVPLGGFKALRGQRGPQKFSIEKTYTATPDALPVSHTCFNQLMLPPGYPDAATLREKLLIAIREGSEGFALV